MSAPTMVSAAQVGLISCGTCALLSRPANAGNPGHCPRCGAALAWRRHNSVQYTWALIVAAAICYIPANVLPVLSTTAFGATESDTIMGGVLFLYASGSWPLALIVFVASVMIPLGKLLALGYLLITVQRGSIAKMHDLVGAGSLARAGARGASRKRDGDGCCQRRSAVHSGFVSRRAVVSRGARTGMVIGAHANPRCLFPPRSLRFRQQSNERAQSL